MEQFRVAMDDGEVETIYVDFADLDLVREAVEMGRGAGKIVAPATLRIYRPGEEHLLEQLAEMKPPAVLVRNLSALDYFSPCRRGHD